MLVDLYEDGVLFIDIVGIPDQEQDVIQIFIKEEYLLDDISEDSSNNISLSEEYLNKLI